MTNQIEKRIIERSLFGDPLASAVMNLVEEELSVKKGEDIEEESFGRYGWRGETNNPYFDGMIETIRIIYPLD